jgi:lipopolysaccharide export system permease protein
LIIYRYLAKEIFTTMAAISGILLLIIFSGRFIVYLQDVVAGELSFAMLGWTMLFRIPSFLELVLPLSFFLSVLLSYGRLYIESEMTVLFACGMSTKRLVLYTLSMSLVVAFIVSLFSLWLSPFGAYKVEYMLQEQAQATEFELLTPGRFQELAGGNRVSYMESLSDDKKEMQQVFIADGDSIIVAERGTQRISNTSGSRFLELHNGKRFDVTTGEQRKIDFDVYAVKIQEQSAEIKVARNEATSTQTLLTSNKLKHKAQLQWRMSLGVLVLISTLIAVPLSKANHRQGRYGKLFPALVLFMVYLTVLMSLRTSIGDGSFPVNPGLWAIHGLFLGIAIFILCWPSLWPWIKGMFRRA